MGVTGFLGFSFDRLSMEDVLARIADRRPDERFGYIVTPNVDHVVRFEAAGDAVHQAYADAELCLCDSRILARIARGRGIDLSVVPGSDLTARLFDRVLKPGDRICIIGSTADQVSVLAAQHPGLIISHHVPPMGFRHDPAAMARAAAFVVEQQARFTLLAVGSPQQELLAAEIRRTGNAVGLGLCIGASIDFLTGAKARAPRWMQKAGLEWAHRLLSEPRRLWRRYLVEGPRIFVLAARWRDEGSR